MKTAAFMIVGPGEGDRYLERVFDQLWVDDICVCLNRADEKTKRIVGERASLVKTDDREWGKEQWRIKQDFLEYVLAHAHPDWIWCLDADEIFDPRFTREEAQRMAEGKDVAWYFWCLQLWNNENQVREDLCFPNVRFYRVVPELGITFQATPLHCGLAPQYAYRFGSQSGLYFKHYGLMLPEDRKRKVARYDQYDPKEKYKGHSWYSALRNEKINPITIEKAIEKLPQTIFRNKGVTKHMKKDRSVYFFRNKHGKVVEAVGSMQRDQFVKIGYQELQSISVQRGPEAPVVIPPSNEPSRQVTAADYDNPAARGAVDEGQQSAADPVVVPPAPNAPEASFPCVEPGCEFVAKNHMGLLAHSRVHKDQKVSTNLVPEAESNANTPLEPIPSGAPTGADSVGTGA